MLFVYLKRYSFLFLVFILFSCAKEKTYLPREVIKYRYNNLPATTVKKIPPPTHHISGLYFKKEFKVGLLLPMTGSKKEIGMQIFDSITLAIQDLKAENIKLFVFDTAGDPIQAQIAAKKVASIGVDIIIGPVFSTETKMIKGIAESFKIPVVSLSNNASLSSKNLHIFGVSPNVLTEASISYLINHRNKRNLAIIMSNTQSGFVSNKYITNIANSMKANVITTQYYTPGDTKSIKESVRKALINKKREYLVDKDGNVYFEKFSKKIKQEENIEREKKEEIVDAVYIDAIGDDLYTMVSHMKRSGFLTEDMVIFSGANIIEDNEIFQNPMSNEIFFVNTATPLIYDFATGFENLFHYRPIRIAAIAYDAFSAIVSVAAKNDGKLDTLTNADGFSGIYGEFRFNHNGKVQRKLYVQKINKKTIELVMKIDKFI